MRVGALIPLGFLAGALICRALLLHPPAQYSVDLVQPLVVVTYWQQFGGALWGALFAAVVIASVGYVSVLRGIPSTTLGVVRYLTMTSALSALACIAALMFPVVFSSDVYAYAGYGAMALHGIDPYAHARITLRDPLLDAVQWQWGNPPPMCVYGPAFVWVAREIVAVTLPLGAAAPLWALRVLACIALVACAPLAHAAFRGFPERGRLAAASGIALNPIAIWSCAEGHNDVLVLAIVLAGFAVLQRGRAFAGVLIVALSALVKAPGAIAAAGLVLASYADRSRFTRVVAGAVAGILIVAALALPLEYGVQTHLAPGGRYFPQISLQALLALAVPLPVAAAVTLSVCACVGVWGALRLLAGRVDGSVLIAFALWYALPNPYPWYAIWILPVAFLVWGTPAAWAIVAATLLAIARYFGEATTDLPPVLMAAVVLPQVLIPLALVTVVRRSRVHPDRPENRTTGPDFVRLHSG